jgi:hypothetical protein
VSRGGHPTRRQPTGAEWKALIADGEASLADLSPSEATRLEALIAAAARKLTVPASEAIPARKVHPKMTRKTKARIVLAWLLYKRRWSPVRIVRLCLCVERWVRQNVDDVSSQDRSAFACHILGARLIQHAHVRDTREVYRSRLERNLN